MLITNTIIDNKYKILDEIGRGGMSIVYRATVERSGKIWAVKEVRKDSRNDYNVVRQNLIAEIETLKEVRHPKLPEIADVIDNEDNFIIVMDYIEGVSLDKILAKKGIQPEEKVVDWSKQLCEVLGYLHSKNIIYRDMKPSNVMLKKNGEITIIDFGTAKKYEYDSGETTGLGTAGFAAPEQYGGHGRTDARTDIFCLGMTMYALLTGHDPQREFIPDTSIRKVNPAFSAGLDYIIRKCTNKNPAERYQSCEELLYDLNRYQDIDKGSRKKKVFKIGLFVSCFCISIVSGVFGYLLQLQAKGLASDTYQELIEKAENITLDEDDDTDRNYNEKIDFYTQAIAVPDKAGEAGAYLGLLETYLENDGVFTEEEHTKFSYLMNQNEEILKNNPENYLDVCYQAGESLWYYYDSNSQKTKAVSANKWFKHMMEYIDENADNEKVKGYLSEKSGDISTASSYYEIGIFYKEIDDKIMKGKDTGMYQDLFQNLQSLMKNITAEKNPKVQLDLLELIAQTLYQYTANFYQDGVAGTDVRDMCNDVQNALNDIKIVSSHPLYPRKNNIQQKLKEAQNVIESVYGENNSGKETETS